MFYEVLADLSCHGQTQICIDVDLADTILGRSADHIFRNALCTRDISPEFIAFLYEFRQNGGCAVEHQRRVRDQAVDLLETFKVEVWLAFEFICAVAGPDSYSQGVNTGFFYEFRSFLRNGESCISGIYIDVCLLYTSRCV